MIDRLSTVLNLIMLKLNVCCTQLALTLLKKVNDGQESSTACAFMRNNFALKQNLSVVGDIMTDVAVVETDLST